MYLRTAGLASGEVSRCNQYMSKMMRAFGNVKHIYQYRMPQHLENPFDQVGEDDVMINVEKFVMRLDSHPAAT